MSREAFEKLIAEEFLLAMPKEFQSKIENVAFLVEDEPSEALRIQEGLGPHETLLGLYHGVSVTARGDNYGIGATLPDTITLFQKPIEEAAVQESKEVRQVIRETIWHEVAHHFGYDEDQIRGRESTRDL